MAGVAYLGYENLGGGLGELLLHHLLQQQALRHVEADYHGEGDPIQDLNYSIRATAYNLVRFSAIQCNSVRFSAIQFNSIQMEDRYKRNQKVIGSDTTGVK